MTQKVSSTLTQGAAQKLRQVLDRFLEIEKRSYVLKHRLFLTSRQTDTQAPRRRRGARKTASL
jgi:hypothetical protein